MVQPLPSKFDKPPRSFSSTSNLTQEPHPSCTQIFIDLPFKPPKAIMLVHGISLLSLALPATAAAYHRQSRIITSKDCPSSDGVHVVRTPKDIYPPNLLHSASSSLLSTTFWMHAAPEPVCLSLSQRVRVRSTNKLTSGVFLPWSNDLHL